MTRLNQLLNQMASRLAILDKAAEYRLSHFYTLRNIDIEERIVTNCRTALFRLCNRIKKDFDLDFRDYSERGKILVSVSCGRYGFALLSPGEVEYMPNAIIGAIKDYNRSIVEYYTLGKDIETVIDCEYDMAYAIRKYENLAGLQTSITYRGVVNFAQVIRADIEDFGIVKFVLIDAEQDFDIDVVAACIAQYEGEHDYTVRSFNDYLDRFAYLGYEAYANYDWIGSVTNVVIEGNGSQLELSFTK